MTNAERVEEAIRELNKSTSDYATQRMLGCIAQQLANISDNLERLANATETIASNTPPIQYVPSQPYINPYAPIVYGPSSTCQEGQDDDT